jgi:hypothetical protein
MSPLGCLEGIVPSASIPVIMFRIVRYLYVAAAIVALASGACATARAKPVAEPARLDVPAPPPRVIVPAGPEAISGTPTPVDTGTKPAQPPRLGNPRQKPTEQKTDAPRPPDPPAAATVPLPATVAPAATLQQELPAAARNELKKQVNDQLSLAKANLGKVTRKNLSRDEQAQFDTAEQFIKQAQQALDENNLVFAAKVAEKAAGLAASLAGR